MGSLLDIQSMCNSAESGEKQKPSVMIDYKTYE